MSPNPGSTFDVFLSYSRKSDADTARQLQRLIRRVGHRWYRQSPVKVYRDQTNTPLSEDLRKALRATIDNSNYFVLLASPTSAKSEWVRFEVAHWLSSARPKSRFGIVLTGGKIEWGDGDFNWQRTDALPQEIMQGWFHEEPAWAHVPPTVERDGRLDEQMRDAARTIVASFSGRDKGAIDSEDQRETRIARRTLQLLAAGLAILLFAAVTTAGVAVTELKDANQQRRLVTAQLLLTQAQATIGANPRMALQMAEAAYSLNPTPEIDDTIVQLLTQTRYSAILTGHTDFVYAVAFAPSGRTLATGGLDKSTLLWDVRDPTRPHRIGPPLTGHTEWVVSEAFSPDGHLLATGSFDKTVILWDVSDPSQPRRLGAPLAGHTDEVSSVVFSPDGHTLATGSFDKTAILWDVHEPARPVRLGTPLTGHTGAVSSVAFSPDGRTLVTGSSDKTAILWNVHDPYTPQRLTSLNGYTDPVTPVTFFADGKTLATGGSSAPNYWDIHDPARPQRLNSSPLTTATDATTPLAFSPDENFVASRSGLGEALTVWNVHDPTRPQRVDPPLTGHTDAVATAAFSPDGHTLATGSDDHTVILWDLHDPTRGIRLGSALTTSGTGVAATAFSPDARTLATSNSKPMSSDGNTVTLWDVHDPNRPHLIGPPLMGHTDSISSLAYSPDGKILATGSDDTTVILWDLRDPTRPQRLGQPLTGPPGSVLDGPAWVNVVAFSPDGTILAVGQHNKTIVLWDVHEPARPKRLGEPLTGHLDFVDSVAFSPDGKTLASGSGDHTVILWDIANPNQPVRRGDPLTGHTYQITSVAFSPDGKTLTAGSFDQTVILWDVHDPDRPQPIGTPLAGHTGFIYSVAFSPDGKTLASGSNDDSTILWDIRDLQHPQRLGVPLKGVTAEISSVAFASNGKTLATGSRDNTTVLWDITNLLDLRDHGPEIACLRSNGGFNPEEWSHFVGSLPYENSCVSP